MTKWFTRNIFFPTMEKIHGQRTLKYLGDLEKSQWLSPQELQNIQEQKMSKLLVHAYENVPYYHQIFKERSLVPSDIVTIEDLKLLPILTKDDFRKNMANLVAKNVDPNSMKMSSTGGTTGEPLRFYVPKDRGQSWAAFWRAFNWYGLDIGDKWAYIWAQVHHENSFSKYSECISRYFRRYIFLEAKDLTPTKFEQFIDCIQKFKPIYLIAFPSALYLFAIFIKENKIKGVSFKAIITSAEKLYDYQKDIIKSAFDCEIYEYYGSGEVLSIAYECPHHSLHISAENIVLEIVNNNLSINYNMVGNITLTDLNNYVMPFIRYQNGDLGSFSDKKCTCGRGLPLLEPIEGRITELIITKRGYLSSPILTTIFKDLPVIQFQIIQENESTIRIKIIKGESFSQIDYDYIMSSMKQYVGDEIQIICEFVTNIPTTTSGKRKIVISCIHINDCIMQNNNNLKRI